MVSNFRGCPHVIKTYIKLNQQHEKRVCFSYQKKYLSSKVSLKSTQALLKQKFDDFIDWYDQFTGMDEVREAQKRVLEDENRFRAAQEERRRVLSELTEVQNKLKEILSEIDNTGRGEERYVLLVTQEHKLLKEEKGILERFSRAEKTERESFAALSSSVKLSHEKERAQSERTKYWSIIGSVLGTVIGVLGSSINNYFKMNELKQLIKNSTNIQVVDCLTHYIESNEEIIKKLQSKTADLTGSGKGLLINTDELLESFSTRLSSIEGSLKKLNENSDKYLTKAQSQGEEETVIVTVPVSSVEEALKKEYTQTKMLLFTIVVLSVVMPIINRYS